MKPESRIYYAEASGNYYLRLVGDVRVTFCTTLKAYLTQLFRAEHINSVVVDLRQARAVDSTTLGLLAKLAIYVQGQFELSPLLVVSDPSMIRLIESMGLDDIFRLSDDFEKVEVSALSELDFMSADTEQAREEVIEAHKTLMGMNSKNMLVFADLVKGLEGEKES